MDAAPAPVSTADPFANGANPFIGPSAAPAVSDPFANGNNPFTGPIALPVAAKAAAKPGPLSNAPDDTYGSSVAKGAATAAIKGAADIPGIVGNAGNLSDMAGKALFAGIQTGVGKLLGSDKTFAQRMAENQAAEDEVHAGMRNTLGNWIDYVKPPSGETFSAPVLAKTGEYEPQSTAGRIGMAGVESAVGSVLPGEGVADTLLNAVKTAAPNFAAGATGQAVTEATGSPLLGAAAGVGTASGAHLAGKVARQGVSALADAIPPITEAQKVQAARRQVGQEMNAAATDPATAMTNIQAQPREIVPGSPGTTAQIAGDRGLLGYEKAVANSPEGKAVFDSNADAQNAARQSAIASIQPQGNVADLPDAVRANAAGVDASTQQAVQSAQLRAATNEQTVDAATQAHLEGAQAAHQSALENIQALKPDASPLETAMQFRAMRDAMEKSGADNVSAAQRAATQARAGSAPQASSPEQVGAALRAPAQAARDTASDATTRLYNALPQDMVAPTSDIAAKAKAIQAGMLPEHSPIVGEEARLMDLAGGYGDQTPLANVNALRGSILSARSVLKNSDPQAYGRLGQLQGAVEDSVDHAVENRAALDQIAVRRGNITQEDALPAQLERMRRAESQWQDATRQASMAGGGGRFSAGSGRSAGGDAGSVRAGSQGNVESDNAPRGESISRGAGADAEGTAESVAPLRQANASYREMKQTFDEGPVGDILAKTGRGQPDLSNAEVAAQVFHAKPTAGEDARAYLKAAGPNGAPALSDAAAYSLHDLATRPDGTFDAGKATKWIDDHKLALAELPPEVGAKFATAAKAQEAVGAALGKQRDTLANFDKSEAGRVAGLTSPGDIVKRVGAIIDGQSAPEQRLGDLAKAARGNVGAAAGLKRAVIEHVLDKFVPDGFDPKTEKLQAYIAAKKSVLGKVLSADEVNAVIDRVHAANTAKVNVEDIKDGRAEAMKQVRDAGNQSVQAALDARSSALSKYDRGLLGQLKGVSASADVLNVIKGAFGAKDGAARMKMLAQEATKVPGATDALKKAVVEHIQREYSSNTEAGISQVMQLKRDALANFMKTKTDALKAAGLSQEQIGLLRAVTEDGLRANRSVSAVSSKGGSDTLANQQMAAKMAHVSKGSMLGHLTVDAGLAAGGHLVGGLPGAFIGKYLGDKVMGSMREAGLQRVKQLRVEAIMNPDVGHALMKEFQGQPNGGNAALLGLRFRQMAIASQLGQYRLSQTGSQNRFHP